MTAWSELDANLRAEGINLKWIGCDPDNRVWNIGGINAGKQGAIVIPPLTGMAHVPFKQVKHEPAYGPPRFERSIDEMREIGLRVALMNDDHKFGWFDVESRWWNSMDRDKPGWFCVATRKWGELFVPAQLAEAVDTPFDEDPAMDGCMIWDIRLGVDGEPRWRQPDVRPRPWINTMTVTTSIKRDDELLSPNITVGVGKFALGNRGTTAQFPVYKLSAPTSGTIPARYWISNGATGEMVRVPPLYKGEHITVDTNPENRIAVSLTDPVDDWTKRIVRNSELLQLILGDYGESGVSVLERFHGQGFDRPLPPQTTSTVTVYSDMPGARVSVKLPQRFERAIS